MQNTLMGYNQELAVEYGLDIIDLAILQWFERFKNKECVSEEGKDFYWLNYQTLIDDLPALGIKSKDRVYRRLKKMEKCGLLIHKYVNEKGSKKGAYSFFAFGEKYPSFVVSEGNMEKAPEQEQEPNQEQQVDIPCDTEQPNKVNIIEIESKLNFHLERAKEAIISNVHIELIENMDAIRDMVYSGQVSDDRYRQLMTDLTALEKRSMIICQ